jgi:hypothetical protein
MQKPISPRVHGILDYMTAGLMFTLPRVMGWGRTATRLMDASAAAATVYSLMTRYELGLVKVLPMKAHLALDAVGGATLLGAAAVMEDEDPDVRCTIAGIGAWEIAASLMTRTTGPGKSDEEQTEQTEQAEQGWEEPSMPQARTTGRSGSPARGRSPILANI